MIAIYSASRADFTSGLSPNVDSRLARNCSFSLIVTRNSSTCTKVPRTFLTVCNFQAVNDLGGACEGHTHIENKVYTRPNKVASLGRKLANALKKALEWSEVDPCGFEGFQKTECFLISSPQGLSNRDKIVQIGRSFDSSELFFGKLFFVSF